MTARAGIARLSMFAVALASPVAWAQPQAGWVADPATGCKAWTWNLLPNQTVAWSGACVDGLAHGRGVAQWSRDGAPYSRGEGEFLGGRMNGQGAATTRGGFAYEGAWREGKPDGWGVFTWSSGQRYEGLFRDGSRHGHGLYTWPDGTSYEGEWRDNKRDGQGVYVTADGTVHSGTWSKGCLQGMDAEECGFR